MAEARLSWALFVLRLKGRFLPCLRQRTKRAGEPRTSMKLLKKWVDIYNEIWL